LGPLRPGRRPSAIRWRGHRLFLLDQTLLPAQVRFIQPIDYRAVVRAIQRLAVRGAPLIGVAGAFALAQEAWRGSGVRGQRSGGRGQGSGSSREHLRRAAAALKAARPTAVNLGWAVGRLEAIIRDSSVATRDLPELLEQEARTIQREEEVRSEQMGEFGAALIRDGFRILTICNTGFLAAPGMGTALAAVYSASRQGKRVLVYVPETRPLLQGARLTTWELSRARVPCVLLTDSMLATIMPEIDIVLVGADRIAANGDTANKIGTYQMALLARQFGKPFYPVAPVSTFDFDAATGADIPIEQRDGRELAFRGNQRIVAVGIRFHNPAFDVTPAKLITGIVTDQGILKPPFRRAIAAMRIAECRLRNSRLGL
jgi:methylthioribose-1-phosphate isomerase